MSGAQLSNYATFLVHPEQAPLSIVLTALSTAAGVALTPLLALVLLGARIPVDAASMALSIVQIVLVPVLAGAAASPCEHTVLTAQHTRVAPAACRLHLCSPLALPWHATLPCIDAVLWVTHPWGWGLLGQQ